MDDFAVVAVDMFQTLVSIDSRRHGVWRGILGRTYSEQRAEEYWALSSRVILAHFHRLTSQKPFRALVSIFEAGFAEVFGDIGLDFDPKLAARILADQHRLCSPYKDTAAFLGAVGKKYPLCLVCDADEDMLAPSLLGLCEFDAVFVSGRLRAYKNDPAGRLFSAVTEHYGVAPERMIHIGDSTADVLGAHRVGMTTCWLNRSERTWSCHVKPDHVASTLLEVTRILGVDVECAA